MFAVPEPVFAAIAGDARLFPVRRIFCVGRNYAAHVKEMGADEREPPFFFTKFAEALVANGETIPYPPATADFQFEGELVLAIGAVARGVSVEAAPRAIFGYAAGLDMTRRDLQFAARDKGRPWDMGKNFAASAPIGAIHPASAIGALNKGELRLDVNGETRQRADIADMIWNSAEIISHLSAYDTLGPGDLIFTGTPAGVGPVQPGDRVRVTIAGLTPLEVSIGAKA